MKKHYLTTAFLAAITLPVLSFPFIKGSIDSGNHENRNYAEFPKITAESLTEFPEDFENWFMDYLPYKNQLTAMNNVKKQVLREGTTALEYKMYVSVIRGKDNWLFYNSNSENENSFSDYMCNNLYTEEELAQITSDYAAFQEKLNDCGTELVVMFAANKEQVYPEYMPSTIVPTGKYGRVEQLTDYINDHSSVTVLYTKDDLIKEKENYQVFYKYDTHWNNLGSFVGEQMINEYFHNEKVSLSDVKIREKEGNVSKDLANLLSMGKWYNDDKNWTVDNYKTDVTVELAYEDKENGYKQYVSNAADKRSVLLVRDSFGKGLMNWLPKDFGKVAGLSGWSHFDEYYMQEKPDIVIVEIVGRSRNRQEILVTNFLQN